MNLSAFADRCPIVPYIRECEYTGERGAYYFPYRRLLDYLIIYIRKGELHIVADGTNYVAKEGQFFLLQPGTVHDLRGHAPAQTPFAHLDLFYNKQRETSFPTRPGQTDLRRYRHLMQPRLNDFQGIHIPVILQPRQPASYSRLLQHMIGSWLAPSPLRKIAAQGAATQLFYEIIRDHAGSDSLPGERTHELSWIRSYLSFHLAEPLSIADMAQRAHLSPSRFREVFRERFDMPPHQYFIRLRLEHAAELLRTTDYSLIEIAEYCGFTDSSHMANTFRKHYGITPGAYREQPQ